MHIRDVLLQTQRPLSLLYPDQSQGSKQVGMRSSAARRFGTAKGAERSLSPLSRPSRAVNRLQSVCRDMSSCFSLAGPWREIVHGLFTLCLAWHTALFVPHALHAPVTHSTAHIR